MWTKFVGCVRTMAASIWMLATTCCRREWTSPSSVTGECLGCGQKEEIPHGHNVVQCLFCGAEVRPKDDYPSTPRSEVDAYWQEKYGYSYSDYEYAMMSYDPVPRGDEDGYDPDWESYQDLRGIEAEEVKAYSDYYESRKSKEHERRKTRAEEELKTSPTCDRCHRRAQSSQDAEDLAMTSGLEWRM